MRRNRRTLFEGENLALELRRHTYTLAGPLFVLLVCAGPGSFLVATVPESGAQKGLRFVVAGGVAVVALRWAVWPFALWYADTLLLTDARLIRRAGLLGRGSDLDLDRVLDVSFTRTPFQRMFGAGALTVGLTDASGARAVLVLDHLPLARDVQGLLVGLVTAATPARMVDSDTAGVEDGAV